MAEDWITTALATIEAEREQQAKLAHFKRLRKAAIAREREVNDIRSLMARP